jgi:hypothetical protein
MTSPTKSAGALRSLAITCLLAVLSIASVPRAEPYRADPEPGSQWSANSVARLMAGLPPSYYEHYGIAQNPAWKEHSAATQAMWETLRNGRGNAIAAFGKKDLPSSCPAGKTLLYPFSGPDFFNAWWLFPGCETIVMFGLEHVGQVPRLETLSERELAQFMKDLRAANTDLFNRNYFITSNMTRQLHTSQLRGVLPMIMTSMALSGLEILSVTPRALDAFTSAPASAADADSADPAEKPVPVKLKSIRKPQGVTVEFRTPDSRVVRRLIYFSVDVSDGSMAMYPDFLGFLRGLGPTTTLVKSGSYLLHARDFKALRRTLLDVTGFLVQDDTGIPYKTLLKHGWDVTLRGNYAMPIPPFQGAYQPGLYAAYEQQHPAPLPFDFGYDYHDRKSGRSTMMIGRRPAASVIASSESVPGARAVLRPVAALPKP